MYAARLYNEREERQLPCIYGAVTTGDEWKSLKLIHDAVYINKLHYHISGIGKIMGILLHILQKDEASNHLGCSQLDEHVHE